VKPYRVGTAAAIVLIAAVAMYDQRNVFIHLEGTAPGDVGPNWYTFWAAALMGVAALATAVRYATTPDTSGEVAFAGRESVTAVLKLVLPMIAYAASFQWLGFYLSTAAFMGFFAAYLGRYKWYFCAASAVITPLAIYVLFELGFKLILPKSIFYIRGFPL
jgi:putative tricarboxylic transport membrane protein